MKKATVDQKKSIFSRAELNKLYEEFAIMVSNSGFDTKLKKNKVVKNYIKKLTELVRRKLNTD